MYQASPQGALKVGPKPGLQNAVEVNQTDEQRMFMNRQPLVFDGKRMRKPVARKTIDYNNSVVRYLESRKWFKNLNSRLTIQPDEAYASEVLPPSCMLDNPINAVTTKFVRTSTNKLRCPIFCVVWTPEGRRLVTGASSGEFTLWNGLTFNFETILTAHDLPVRSMVWSHNDSWLLSGDHGGVVKYWQSNMNNVQMYEAHKEPIRGLSFSPTDNKYASCADDGLVKIWDFYRCTEENILRGHGADVKCIDWHPHKSLLVSGSKDSQQPIKLWDTRTGNGLATLHLHKNTVMSIKWNQNGNWLLTASRDHLLKLFDIRMMRELQSFRGHKREATAIAWHPIHESLFASGGSDGSIMFWNAGVEKDVGNMESAHDGMVWSLAWHPLGHILCSGSNDHSSKFWTRNKLGDRMRDKYNLNMQDTEDDLGDDIIGAPASSAIHAMAIPGMEATAESMDYDDGFDYASLPGFKGNQKQNEAYSNFSRPGGPDKTGIPGFGSPPKPAQLPPFAQPGGALGPRFGPGPGRGVPFRPHGDGGFDIQHKQHSGPVRNEQDRPWQPNIPSNVQFQQGQHTEEQGAPKQPRDNTSVNWVSSREPPRNTESRGQEFPRDSSGLFKRVLQNQGVDRKDGILGSPPHGKPDMWSRGPPSGLGLLGPVPQLSGGPDSRRGILGPQPGKEQIREHDLKRPEERENDEGREPFDIHLIHPKDLSSRGFRQGIGRGGGQGRGNDPNRRPDQFEERNGDNRLRGLPFQRGFKVNTTGRGGPQGPTDNRRQWPPSTEPTDPRFRRQDDFSHPDRRAFDRPQWDAPKDDQTHPREEGDFRGPPNHHGREFVPRDPRAGSYFGRAPLNDGPDASERRTSDDSQRPQDGKPPPLMSLMSINPILTPHNRNHELDEPERPILQRKRPGEGEHDREWDNVGPQQKLKFPHPGPPEERRDQIGWRGRGGMR